MRKNEWVTLALIVLLTGMLFAVSCVKQQVQPAKKTTAPTKAIQPDTLTAEAAGVTRAEAKRMKAEAKRMKAEKERMKAERLKAKKEKLLRIKAQDAFVNEDIYFEFRSSVLLPTAQKLLMQKAAFLRSMPEIDIIIEGNCDERGTNAFNLALGERRAQAVKDFLVNMGVGLSRLRTISYGEEFPVDPRHTEEAWAQNRRVHLVIN